MIAKKVTQHSFCLQLWHCSLLSCQFVQTRQKAHKGSWVWKSFSVNYTSYSKGLVQLLGLAITYVFTMKWKYVQIILAARSLFGVSFTTLKPCQTDWKAKKFINAKIFMKFLLLKPLTLPLWLWILNRCLLFSAVTFFSVTSDIKKN